MHRFVILAARSTLASAAIAAFACSESNRIVDPPDPVPLVRAPTAEELSAIDIVYGSQTGLFTSKADGTSRKKLAAGDFRGMTLSPDRTRVAYTRNGTLFVSYVDGTDAEEVASSVLGRPAWSPDQGRIVVSRVDGLYVIDLTTREQRQITWPVSESIQDVQPSWSPDGKRIAFARSDLDLVSTIFTVNPDPASATDQPDITPISSGPSAGSPIWSADGARIAYYSFNSGIQVVSADGKAIVLLRMPRPTGYINSISDWSEDGKWIAFTVTVFDHLDTYVGDFDGRSARLDVGDIFGAISLRKPLPPPASAPVNEAGVYEGPPSLYSWTGDIVGTEYVLYDDGRFALRFFAKNGSDFEFKGKRTAFNNGFTFAFDANPGRWEATATIADDILTIHYNQDMLLSDFVDGPYTRISGPP